MLFLKIHSDPGTALPLQSFVNADLSRPPLQTAVCLQFIHSLYLHQSNLTSVALPCPGHQYSMTLLLQSGMEKSWLCFHTMTPGVNKHDPNRVTRVFPFLQRVMCLCERERSAERERKEKAVLMEVYAVCFLTCVLTHNPVWPK